VIEDPIFSSLLQSAKKVDPFLESNSKDVDEDIEEFLEDEETDLLSTDNGELYYYCHVYRRSFDDDYNLLVPPPVPKETKDLFQYIEKEYKKFEV
jgi:hypothetical protein